jgi:acetolactate synthase-1/2/3 large subunit
VARKFWSRHFKLRALNTSGVIPVGLCCTFTTLFTSKIPYSMFWCAMSRLQYMPPMAMRAPRVRSALHWSHQGPGVTNAVTGIATAYMDSIPMVIISGQVPTHAIGLDAFQECDAVGITRPIVKHNFLVKDARDLAETMKKAFHIARSGRPGPVLVDIPKDVSFKKVPYTGYPTSVEMRSYNPVRKGHGGQIRKALQLLLAAKRPYIYTGGGVLLSNASAELRTLVDMLGYPCTNTLMGLGAYPASSSKFLGMLGMHGTLEANNAMQNCDVLLAVGARFDDRVIGNPKHFAQNERKIIHIDIDPSSISKRVKVDIPIVGDVKDVLIEMIAMIKEGAVKAGCRCTWCLVGND